MEKQTINFPGYGDLEFDLAGMKTGIISEQIVNAAMAAQAGRVTPEAIRFLPGERVRVIAAQLDDTVSSGIGVWIWDGKSPHGEIICSSLITVCKEEQ